MRRMHTVNIHSFEQYLDYLQVHQEEFAALFNTILINVTSFFRDAEVWTYLDQQLLPRLLESRDGEPLRIWSAGCASGQEAYTIAMLIAEHVGAASARDRAKIYATDVDEEALGQARQAVYKPSDIEGVPDDLRTKYFEPAGGAFVFSRDVRRAVIFGRHDLLQDAPISRVDLLLCRNTLMYFNADAQARVVARLFFSMVSGGLLLLGRAEMLFSYGAMFMPVDLKKRLFRAVEKPTLRDRMLILAETGRDAMANNAYNNSRLRDAAFEADVSPQILVDGASVVVGVTGLARKHLGVPDSAVGRPLQDLDVSFRPVELRGPLDRAVRERQEVVLQDIQWTVDGHATVYDVYVVPVLDDGGAVLGTRITFVDRTQFRQLHRELEHSKQELETAYEELQSTNEELETTNEELQSTVEELETTNEELQSTNEELETMNEELQSTNEELQTMNDELRNRSTDLNSVNSFLESIFTSLRSAVVVVDRDFHVVVWNNRAADMWGVRPDEAHRQNFMGLDIGLPVGNLRQPIRDILRGAEDFIEVSVPAVNRRGRRIECRVNLSPLRQEDRTVDGAILLMEEKQPDAVS
jgi:two-component system, chemotaxis family, CheB/CheR fusion protein